MAEWAIYGGSGFIGQHLAFSILSACAGDRVYCLDIQSPEEAGWRAPIEQFIGTGRLTYVETDVRNRSQMAESARNFDVIVNLAAIHREPGHRPEEYFETNISGAENVCQVADSVGCREIIFTSSISVYGIHDRAVDEHTTPEPKTPYGQSKLEAEQIHSEWAEKSGGRLSVIRPGVVFGPGENGNVTRLVRETLRLKRQIRVSPDQPKAGIYIEELLAVISWLRQQTLPAGQRDLVNGVSDENLTFNAHGQVLEELMNFGRRPLTVPEAVFRVSSTMLAPLGWMLGTGSKFHPERLAKLTRPNDIRPTELVSRGYPYAWPLSRAMTDWLEKGL